MEPTCSAILASRRERPKSLKRIVINEGKSCLSKYKKSLKGNAWSQVRDRDDCWKISSIDNKSVDLSVKKCIESKNNQNRKKVKVCWRTLLAFLLKREKGEDQQDFVAVRFYHVIWKTCMVGKRFTKLLHKPRTRMQWKLVLLSLVCNAKSYSTWCVSLKCAIAGTYHDKGRNKMIIWPLSSSIRREKTLKK